MQDGDLNCILDKSEDISGKTWRNSKKVYELVNSIEAVLFSCFQYLF